MQNLIERRANALRDNQKIAEHVQAQGRPFNREETKQVSDNFELAKELEKTIEATRQIAEAIVPEPVAAPVLADGGSGVKNFRELRTVGGGIVRAYGKGQRIHTGATNGMNLSDFGTGLAAIISGDNSGARAEVRSLSEGQSSQGGFFVSEELSSQLIDASRNRSRCFQAGATTVAMNSDTLRLVTVETDPEISLASENAVLPSGDPAFGSHLLVAKKHGVLIKVSNELLADGAGAGTAIANALAGAFGVYLDKLVLDYLIASPSIGGTDSIGAITYDDLLDARQAIMALNGEPNALIANPKTLTALAKLKESTTNAYLQPPVALANIAMLDSANIADTSLIMGAWDQAVVGIRQAMTIQISQEAGFDYDQAWIRLLFRGDVGHLKPHFHELSGLSY